MTGSSANSERAGAFQSDGSRRLKPITRRRGACKSCRARKVRCDGQSPCNQCLKFGFECHYLPGSHKRRTSSGDTQPGKVASCTDQQQPHGSLHATGEVSVDTSSQSKVILQEDISMPDFFLENDGIITNVADLSSNFEDINTELILSPTSEYSAGLDWDNQQVLSEIETTVISPHTSADTMLFSPLHGSLQEQDFLHSGEQQLTSHHTDFGSGDSNSVAKDLIAVDSTRSGEFSSWSTGLEAYHEAGKLKQGDLIKDALLEEVKEFCRRWRAPQGEELSHAFQKSLSGNVTIYPCKKGEIVNAMDHLLLDRMFVSDRMNACLQYSQSLNMFLDQHVMESAIGEITDQRFSASPKRGLAYAILALGTHIVHSEHHKDKIQDCEYEAMIYFNIALGIEREIPSDTFSISHFQALVVMAHFATCVGLSEASCLLSRAIRYAQVMRLNRCSSITKLSKTSTEQQEIQKAFWHLFCLEKIYCLRTETFPVLDEDFADHSPTSLIMSSMDVSWLAIQCHYANLCVSILKEFFSQNSLRNKDPTSLMGLQDGLNRWLQSLPATYQSIEASAVDLTAMSPQERSIRLNTFFQYHEASLVINFRNNFPRRSSLTLNVEMGRLNNDQQCASSIREILAMSSHITASDVLLNPSIYRLMCIATCSLAASTIRDPTDRRDLSYLAIAAGFFGRMTLGNIEGPLEEITNIVRIAQRSITEKCGRGA